MKRFIHTSLGLATRGNWSIGILAFLVFSPAMSRPSAAQDSSTVSNLIPNPSFEENPAGGVRSWKQRAWHGEADGRWTIESPGRTGERCLSIRSETGSDAAWTTTVSVRSNSFYRLSGWIRTKDIRFCREEWWIRDLCRRQ